MDNNTVLPIISSLLQEDIMTDSTGIKYVREEVYYPLETLEYRYKEDKEDGTVLLIDVYRNGRLTDVNQVVPFRRFLWERLRLDNIQRKYEIEYGKWKEWNEGVDYVPVQVVCDSAPRKKPRKSNEFFDLFCRHGEDSGKFDGLSLVMAEYGMGKSSFCLSVCKMAVDENGWRKREGDSEYVSLKDAFCHGNTAFPLLFSLNNCRNDDFDEYIQNRLFSQYNLSLNFEAFQKLCCNGYFCTVLDAWDQMHHTPYASQVEKSFEYINQLSERKGRVLITCRRSFYQKQLKLKTTNIRGSSFETIRPEAIFTLSGFDKDSALEYLRKASETTGAIPSEQLDDKWISQCWKQNGEFLEKPLNVRLLAGHFKTVMKKHDLQYNKVRTYDFLEDILEKWHEDTGLMINSDAKSDPLKKLVYLTLSSGLNRGVEIDRFKKIIGSKKAEKVLGDFRKLDFLYFQEDSKLIEFRLAAFQEFLWTRYILKELSDRKLLGKEALLNAYMLTLEARAWLTEELRNQENNVLYIQLKGDDKSFTGLQYKQKAEIGYCASNVLTLYRDLNAVKYYRDQFQEMKQNLRHYCFEEADLRGLDLSKASFDYSDLVRADFSYTELSETSFRGADLSETTWDEFGRINKCAFIENSSDIQSTENKGISVAAGTESGSVLTYNIQQTNLNIMNLGDYTINAIAADTEGVYTASQNGWVGYIEASSGDLKNAYITANGLESVAPIGHASVYVGTEDNGLFRYDWMSGVKRAISIDRNIENISNVNYYKKNNDERYIACISGRSRKEIYILKLNNSQAEAVVHGKLGRSGFSFDDICFAGEYLVLAVAGKGVFSISLSDLLNMGELDDIDLCNVENCRYSYRGNAVLDWAEKTKQLFVMEKFGQRLYSIICIPWEGKIKPESWDLEWNYNGRNYVVTSEAANFCVSADATYLAVSGERLAVFEKQEDYYGLVKEPVEASINVTGADFRYSKGLGETQELLFNDHGALTDR